MQILTQICFKNIVLRWVLRIFSYLTFHIFVYWLNYNSIYSKLQFEQMLSILFVLKWRSFAFSSPHMWCVSLVTVVPFSSLPCWWIFEMHVRAWHVKLTHISCWYIHITIGHRLPLLFSVKIKTNINWWLLSMFIFYQSTFWLEHCVVFTSLWSIYDISDIRICEILFSLLIPKNLVWWLRTIWQCMYIYFPFG